MVKNYTSAIANCVLETLSYAEQAARSVPLPGIITFKTAHTIAKFLLIRGTLVIKAQTALSVSSTLSTFSLRCALAFAFASSWLISMPPMLVTPPGAPG